MTAPGKSIHILLQGLKIALQVALIFPMLFCVFGFAASYEYPSINRFQIAYTTLLLLFSFLFYKLASSKAHKTLSSYLVALVFFIWFIALIVEGFFLKH